MVVHNKEVDMEKLKEYNNLDSYYTRVPKKKKICKEEEYDVDLHYIIYHAEGLDDPNSFPDVTRRNYGVISWINPDKERFTDEVQGLLNPVWKQRFWLPLDKNIDCKFLNVEVVRLWSMCDPGTSNGKVVVGRARIPLPKEVSTQKSGRYGLTRMVESECKGEGHIIVSMELKKREYLL